MWNIVEQAKLMYGGQPDFLHWLYGLVGACSAPEMEYYTTGTVFRDLLGYSHRIYQVWEKREDFPVREPERRVLPLLNVLGRAYTPGQVAQIAYWVWERNQEKEGGDQIEDG